MKEAVEGGGVSKALEARVRAWMREDIDPDAQRELDELLARTCTEDAQAAWSELEARFRGPLRFGTAGLRAPVGAGESRMNRSTVVRATAGLADYLLAAVPGAETRGVVLGRDARHGSQAFQEDAAGVFRGKGLKVHWLPAPVPTPVVAFGVRSVGAAAGVMITASHNPPGDNGYKVFASHGGQIAPPLDREIAEAIDAQPGARRIVRASAEASPERFEARPELVDAYLAGLASVRFCPEAPVDALRVVYTAMHGVAGGIFLEALSRRGFRQVEVVEAQQAPDPNFPSVTFPNPEEPGALDLARAQAERSDAHLVLAHDPDGDRLAALVRCPRRGWVRLSGNAIGILLAHHLIEHCEPRGRRRLVVNTLVSSRMLARMAERLGVEYIETLTGFKHIAAAMRRFEAETGGRALLGYEEALGYAVSRQVHDKDGISAGLVLAEMAAASRAVGMTLVDRLEALHREYGLFVEAHRSVWLLGPGGPQQLAEAMARLRTAEPSILSALGVREVWDLKTGLRTVLSDGRTDAADPAMRGDVLVLSLQGGARVAVRPSGTEPKLKLYLEAEAPWPPGLEHDEAVRQALPALERVAAAILGVAGLKDLAAQGVDPSAGSA